MSALLAGALAFAGVVAAGLLVAVTTTASSVIGGFESSVVKEVMLQACALVGASFSASGEDADFAQIFGVDVSVQTMPALGLAVPVAAMGLAVRSQLARTADTPPLTRLVFVAGAAVPFALLMIIPAAIGEATDDDVTYAPNVGAVFGLSLLWGVIGALLGGQSVVRDAARRLGPRGGRVAALARPPLAALRALVIALAASAILMTTLVIVQTIRDEGDAVGDRSTAGAVVENALYVVEHGTHGVELGTFASFDLSTLARFAIATEEEDADADESDATGILVPLPVEDLDAVLDVDSEDEDVSYRVFNYSDAMATYVFIPWVIVLIALPALLALYAGFASARAAGAATTLAGALWGASAGPVWAVAMVVVNAITKGTDLFSVFGHAVGESVFGWTLLIATGLGALGGLLATRKPEPAPPGPSAAPPPPPPPGIRVG